MNERIEMMMMVRGHPTPPRALVKARRISELESVSNVQSHPGDATLDYSVRSRVSFSSFFSFPKDSLTQARPGSAGERDQADRNAGEVGGKRAMRIALRRRVVGRAKR